MLSLSRSMTFRYSFTFMRNLDELLTSCACRIKTTVWFVLHSKSLRSLDNLEALILSFRKHYQTWASDSADQMNISERLWSYSVDRDNNFLIFASLNVDGKPRQFWRLEGVCGPRRLKRSCSSTLSPGTCIQSCWNGKHFALPLIYWHLINF